MTSPPDLDRDVTRTRAAAHVLQIDRIELVGGGRTVSFGPGLNIVRGDITTGKTTLVRLLRALLSTVPRNLPPEVASVRFLRGDLRLGGAEWRVLRPLTTTRDTPVELAKRNSQTGDLDEAVRVPAAGREASYSRFLLERLSLPLVSVPTARQEPTASMTPVSAADWLGYCIVTGDDLDSQVFGHLQPFRDYKRRWVFELVYGLYDVQTAQVQAELRGLQMRLDATRRETEIVDTFLTDTPFADRGDLLESLLHRQEQLAAAEAQQAELAGTMTADSDVTVVREALLAATADRDGLREEHRNLTHQLADLEDLRKQLQSQSARLTRAIVADEWLVDFEFVVCPRCGAGVDDHRADTGHCYLCLQPQRLVGAPDALLAEQDRVMSQLQETDMVLDNRRALLEQVDERIGQADDAVGRLSAELDHRTASFVSARASAIRGHAEQLAAVLADIDRLREYLQLFDRRDTRVADQDAMATRIEELQAEIDAAELSQTDADEHIAALERRLLDYLEELHIPLLSDLLTVRVSGPTWLPHVSNRSFDELSSQGLKTLVNAAHALAHHTVAIDRGLPLPGLLVLDGLSANAGREGFDGARIEDLYRLLDRVSREYEGLLQIIAVDNQLPAAVVADLEDRVVLTLSQKDRLIQAVPSQLSEDQDRQDDEGPVLP
jgi:hypothetical protein